MRNIVSWLPVRRLFQEDKQVSMWSVTFSIGTTFWLQHRLTDLLSPVIDFISKRQDTTSSWLQNRHLKVLATPAFFFFATFFAAFFRLPILWRVFETDSASFQKLSTTPWFETRCSLHFLTSIVSWCYRCRCVYARCHMDWIMACRIQALW